MSRCLSEVTEVALSTPDKSKDIICLLIPRGFLSSKRTDTGTTRQPSGLC